MQCYCKYYISRDSLIQRLTPPRIFSGRYTLHRHKCCYNSSRLTLPISISRRGNGGFSTDIHHTYQATIMRAANTLHVYCEVKLITQLRIASPFSLITYCLSRLLPCELDLLSQLPLGLVGGYHHLPLVFPLLPTPPVTW